MAERVILFWKKEWSIPGHGSPVVQGHKEQRISLGASERHCQLGVISLPVLGYAMDKVTSNVFHHRFLLLCQTGDNWENLSD